MAQLGSWNGYTFEVSPNLVRTFEEMSLKGHCETETKTKSKQKYVVRKNGDVTELTFTVSISALLGVTDVRSEAEGFVKSANNGDKAYFYYGTKKLVAPKMMLTSAEITEIEPLPGEPTEWISAKVKSTFKQASNDGSSGSSKKKKRKKKGRKGGSGGGNGNGNMTTTDWIKTGIGVANAVIAVGKAASKSKLGSTLTGGLAYQENVIRKVTTTGNSATKKLATTGRNILNQAGKLITSAFKRG